MMNTIWRPIKRRIGFGPEASGHRSIWGFVKKFLNDCSTDYAALLAYNFIIALLPLAVAAFGIFGLVFRHNPEARKSVVDAIIDAQPDNNTKTAVREVTDKAADDLEDDAAGILIVGIVFSIFGGSRLLIAMEKVLNILHRAPARSFIYQNLIAMGMLVVVIILFLVLFGAAGAPSFLINVIPGENGAQFGIFIAGICISIFIGFVLFFVLYFVLPNRKISFKTVWCGALVGSILLDIFVVLFPLYIRRFMGSFLGLIGFAILLILFFYYFSLIFIIGAQINVYFFDRIFELPDNLVTYISKTVQRLELRIHTNRPNFPQTSRIRPIYRN